MSDKIKLAGPFYAYREDRITHEAYKDCNWGVKDSQGHLVVLGKTKEEAEASADRRNKEEGFK